jgi:hypothetical protein
VVLDTGGKLKVLSVDSVVTADSTQELHRTKGRKPVLTKTQLTTAKTGELERLQARIQTELDMRVEQELQRLKREPNTGKEQLFYSGHTRLYQWEIRTVWP